MGGLGVRHIFQLCVTCLNCPLASAPELYGNWLPKSTTEKKSLYMIDGQLARRFRRAGVNISLHQHLLVYADGRFSANCIHKVTLLTDGVASLSGCLSVFDWQKTSSMPRQTLSGERVSWESQRRRACKVLGASADSSISSACFHRIVVWFIMTSSEALR